METRRIAQAAVLTALVTVATMVINIPMPAVKGFVNLGDTVILVSGLLFGPWIGLFAGGIGSALADVFLGYSHWAPLTLFIKGIEGFLAGRLAGRPLVALPVAALWMIAGYFLAATGIYGIGPAVAALPGDLFQAGASVVIALVLARALRKRLSIN